MVRPQKPIHGSRRLADPVYDVRSSTKDKYFATPEQVRSKYDARPSSAGLVTDDQDEIDIVIDLREDSVHADEPRTDTYYERFGPTRS